VLWYLIDLGRLRITLLLIWLLDWELAKLRLVLHADLKDLPSIINFLEFKNNLEIRQSMLAKTLDSLTALFNDSCEVKYAKFYKYFIYFYIILVNIN
jgi:hypothetical protein